MATQNAPRRSSQSRVTPASRPSPNGATQPHPRARLGLPDAETYPALLIEDVWPELDGGRWPVKREVGGVVEVWADVLKEGHDLARARILYRHASDPEWQIAPMRPFEQDRWVGSFQVNRLGRYCYTVEAFTDVFGSWRSDLEKRVAAGQDVASELLEGRGLVVAAAERASAADRRALHALLTTWERVVGSSRASSVALSPDLALLMERSPDTSDATRYWRELEVVVDRERARFAAWYEIFPRSQGTDPTRSARFREAEARLPAIAAMGFDVLYLTPIHPIGRTNRKGANNTLVAGPNDPGSPYAIGGEAGGHTAVAPELGTMEDFLHFQQAARRAGLELALDFAIQVSPDHPWVREHPEWFYHRPDGTVKYAENPPKKYEDIYPLNFRSPQWKQLWAGLRDVVLFWAEKGVRIFRVDNPHTKPLAFWDWFIREVQAVYPDVIFLSEAFTRPKMMRALAKVGFTQSYTYFTWRNTKGELTEYLTELTRSPLKEYFRGHFFTNTPDILPEVLQTGGRPAFRLRLVLATTLSSLYGIYNGFELCENRPRDPESEYYADSEMYQHKVWDWNRPGNVVEDVTRINRIRRENPALQLYDNLRFFWSENDQVLFYGKATPDHGNVIFVAVNLDPFNVQASWLEAPMHEMGIGPDQPYVVHDLLADRRFTWRGNRNWVSLNPQDQPAHIFRVELPGRQNG